MKKIKVETEEVSYPCPRCGHYEKPYMYSRDGYAYMLCPKCNVQYRTSTKVSANFRKFCSKIAQKPNRSQSYYTSTELKVRKLLEDNGYVQGRDFWHNIMFEKDKRHRYWVDFIIPDEKLILEVNPTVWHRLWSREKSDNKKFEFLESLGYRVVSVNEKNYKSIVEYLQWQKI